MKCLNMLKFCVNLLFDMSSANKCPLCDTANTGIFHPDPHYGDYYECPVCRLVFLESARHPDRCRERERYALHQNSIADDGYCRHLCRLLDVLTPLLHDGDRGLDYGCGEQPVLSELMGRRGFPMLNYDPFFHPEKAVLNRQYEFITCTETVEHFRRPAVEFQLLRTLLKPLGILGVMTSLLEDECDFARWSYRQDFTHTCFYRRATMEWIARRYGWRVSVTGANVVVFREKR